MSARSWISRSIIAATLLVFGLAGTVGPASAHVNYGASLFSDSSIIDPVTGALGTGVVNTTPNRTVSSNAGWLAGQDNTTQGNSHDNRFLYFNLAQSSTIDFTITGNNTNGNGVLNPGYSLFSGFAPATSHDGAVIPALNATQTGFASWSPFVGTNAAITGAGGTLSTNYWGSYKSNGDFAIGADSGTAVGQFSTLHYLDAGSNGSGNAVSGSYTLGPGIYSLVVGGANASALTQYLSDAQASNSCATAGAACTAYTADRLARTFNIQFSAAPVPIPAAAWLFGSSIAGIVALARRRMS